MTLVDTHVHLYNAFRLSRALDCAATNFKRWNTHLGLPTRIPPLLMLVEAEDDDVFLRLRSGDLIEEDLGRWSVSRTGDAISLSLVRDDGDQLIIVAGRQLTTTEGVEVLALACVEDLRDRRSLIDTIAWTFRHGGMPVLPWGFGKWLGRRGRLVRQIIETEWSHKLALGDTSYRPRAPYPPRNFRMAASRGIPILAGTDPLPYAGQQGKIGRYGVVLREEIDAGQPGCSARACLRSLLGPVESYGQREPLLPNLRLQTHMQLRKLANRPPRGP